MMNDIVPHIYVIHMAKHVERLRTFHEEFDHRFSYEIFEGVDVETNDTFGRQYEQWKNKYSMTEPNKDTFNWAYYLDQYPDLQKGGIRTKEGAWKHWCLFGKKEGRCSNPHVHITHKGQWGCLQSHINVLRDAIQCGYESVLIMEDDCQMNGANRPMEEEIYAAGVKKIKDLTTTIDWKIIYLGAAQDEWGSVQIRDGMYIAHETRGTFAYMVHNSFYEELVSRLEERRNRADVYLIQLQKQYDFFVLFPNLFICDLSSSETGPDRINEEWIPKFKWLK